MSATVNQQPRLCHLVKQNSSQEYGFDLHSSKSRGGQFIGVVDKGSPAHEAGLLQNDTLIAVNGSPVQNMSHKEVVARIRQDPIQCYLTVQTLPLAPQGDRRHRSEKKVNAAEWNYDDDDEEEVRSETKSSDLRPASEESYDVGHGSRYAKAAKPPLSPANTSDQVPAHFNNSSSVENDNNQDQCSAAYNDGAPSSFNNEIVLRKKAAPASDFDRQTLTPKWCRLMKKRPKDDFGFNLIADKKRGYFVGKIDRKSIAEAAGLTEGLRVVGVNYQLIDLSVGYKDVVNLILKYPMHVTLMVATEETHEYYSSNHINYDFNEAAPLISQGKTSSAEEIIENIKMDESSPTTNTHQNDYERVTRRKDNPSHFSSVPQYKQQTSLNLKEPRQTFASTRPISLYAGSANNPNFVLSENFFQMSVAEVRELISKQKKVDPRNNALSLLEKYNIVRNL